MDLVKLIKEINNYQIVLSNQTTNKLDRDKVTMIIKDSKVTTELLDQIRKNEYNI